MTRNQPLFPKLTKLVWIGAGQAEDVIFFMHAGVKTFHVCLPDFPEVEYSPMLMAVPRRMPHLRCFRTFLLSSGTEELWEAELAWVQSRLKDLHEVHGVMVYDDYQGRVSIL
jgi:hypothetical protein